MKKIFGITGAIVTFVMMSVAVVSCSPYDPDDDDDDDMMTRSERVIDNPSEDDAAAIADYTAPVIAE